MTDDSDPSLLERVWTEREEQIYPRMFGPLESSIYPLDAELFRAMGAVAIDPRWLHVGVMVAPPTATRPTWAYLSSGLSNPWSHGPRPPSEPSGFGAEFVLEVPTSAPWVIHRLQHLLAFALLASVGQLGAKEPLGLFDRLPLRGPIEPGTASRLTWLVIVPGPEARAGFTLASGHVDLWTVLGVTEEEAAWARAHGGPELVDLLTRASAFPVTDPSREGVLLPA